MTMALRRPSSLLALSSSCKGLAQYQTLVPVLSCM